LEEIKVFVASSIVQFQKERLRFESFVQRINQQYLVQQGFYLRLVICEALSNQLRIEGMQTYYNGYIVQMDGFVLLSGADHIGDYSLEELGVALSARGRGELPKIWIFRKKEQAAIADESIETLQKTADDNDIEIMEFDDISTVEMSVLSWIKERTNQSIAW